MQKREVHKMDGQYGIGLFDPKIIKRISRVDRRAFAFLFLI